ncbi:MAG: hypothetical protein IKT60_01400, partial [Clostridia bacterium]|nr:hypothetical protein [Clostridia bacterium]
MQALFLELFNLALSAGWLALAILIVRLIFPRLPKGIRMGMWALLGLRLCLPFSLESALSLIPSRETLPPEILLSPTPEIESGIPAVNAVVNPVLSGALAPEVGASVNPMQVLLFIAGVIWAVGGAAMLLYGAISWLRLRWRVRVSAPYGTDALLCDGIDTPFILGLFRPRIYLPSAISEESAAQVLRHERAHLARRDHIWKPLGFLLLAVYWFHPVFWFAFCAFAKDIEYACDARVIRDMDLAARKSYSEALLAASARRYSLACPLAFGEEDVRGRLKAVLSYKKPAFWLSIVGIVLCIGLAVGFLTDPVSLPWQSDNVGITGLTCGAEYENIVFAHEYDTLSGRDPRIEVRWENKTADRTLCFGETFRIFRGEEQIGEDKFFSLTQIQISPGRELTDTIYLKGLELIPGDYRLVKYFWFADDPDTKHEAYIDFVVGPIASFLGKCYSFDEPSDLILEELSGITLYVPDVGGCIYLGAELLGEYDTYTELTRENFDLLFDKEKRSEARVLRRNNNITVVVYDYGKGLFRYLLEQKNGEIWFIEGETEKHRIRGAYRLREITPPEAESQESEPWGITMETIMGDGYDLTINLYRDGTVPVDGKLSTGSEFQIFRIQNGELIPYIPLDTLVFDLVMYMLPENGKLSLPGSLRPYGPLTPGTYAITKTVRLEKPDGSYIDRTYAHYFAILGEVYY